MKQLVAPVWLDVVWKGILVSINSKLKIRKARKTYGKNK